MTYEEIQKSKILSAYLGVSSSLEKGNSETAINSKQNTENLAGGDELKEAQKDHQAEKPKDSDKVVKSNLDECLELLEKSLTSELDIEKGKKATAGEIRTHGGKKVQKQPDGSWKPVKEGKSAEKEEAKKTSPIKLKNGDEGTFTTHEGETLFYRVYSDGGVKVEGFNMREDFATKEEAEKYINNILR